MTSNSPTTSLNAAESKQPPCCDPTFTTWSTFGVQANSQFAFIAGDLSNGTELAYGWSPDVEDQILAFAESPEAAAATVQQAG